jgi:ADP-heptose:LPS heptosyltransferase
MSDQQRLVVFCSLHHYFPKLLDIVRKHYPEAHITAVVPSTHQVVENERSCTDEILVAPIPSFSILRAPGLLRLCRDLRAREVDVFITQFESVKLRTIVGLSRPGQALAWLGGGQVLPLSTSLGATWRDLIVHRIRGYATTLAVGAQCYLWPLKSALPDAKRPPRPGARPPVE